MKLSKQLRQWRAERPGEYTMDRFIKEAERLEAITVCDYVVTDISSETHIDIINDRPVTWCLDDEPELPTTPSCFVRNIVDVKLIEKLEQEIRTLNKLMSLNV